MKIWWFIVLLFLLSLPSHGQMPVSFTSEYIDFTLDDRYFTVDGIFNFNNRSNQVINHGILFPFSVQTCQIDSICVFDLRNLRQLPIQKLKNEIIFNLTLAPLDSTTIHIYYRQLKSKKNCYILTSAQSWGVPLNEAIYTLTIDRKQRIDSFSLAPDSSNIFGDQLTFYWRKTGFMPQSDFEILLAE